MAISAGVAYVDVLPNMGKFAPALAGQTTAASGVLAKFGKVGALALGAVGVGSVVMAADFEKSMRNVNSIAKLPEPTFDRLNDKVLDLAGPTAQAPKTLADGLYDLVSSGFDAKESMVILEASAKAATAGLTTTDVATKGVAAVLNAYRLPASKASQVSDQLFKTVDQGVISFEELAGGIGDTLPFAAALDVGLDEVGAATATMTKQGLSGAETFTRIRNLMQTMIKPGEDLSAAIKDLGYENGEALIKAEGFQGALEAIVGTTDGTKDEVAKLFPNIRALGGALALTGDNAKAARRDLEAMQEATGATGAAFKEQSKSVAFQFERLKSNLSVLAIRMGSAILPVLNDVLQFLNKDLAPGFKAVFSDIKDFADPIVDAVGSAIEDAAPVLAEIGDAIGTTFSDIVGVVGPIIEDLVGTVSELAGELAPVFSTLVDAAKNLAPLFEVVKGMAKLVGGYLLIGLKGANIALGLMADLIGFLAPIIADVFGFFANILGDVTGFLDGIADGIGDIFDSTNHLQEASNNVDDFSASVLGMGDAVVAGVGNVYGPMKDFEQSIGTTFANVGRAASGVIGDIMGTFTKIGRAMAKALTDGFKSVGRGAIDVVKDIAGKAANAARRESNQFGETGKLLGETMRKGLGTTVAGLGATGKQIANSAVVGSNSQRGAFQVSGRGHGQNLAAGLRSTAGTISAAGRSIAASAAAAAGSAASAFFSAGAAMGNSLAAGLRSAQAGVAAAAAGLAAAARAANSGGNRAMGGPVKSGSTYVVGELGPELFTPSRSGYIVPNNRLAGAQGIGGAASATHFVIDNWQDGTGHFRAVAAGEVNSARRFDGQRARMGRA